MSHNINVFIARMPAGGRHIPVGADCAIVEPEWVMTDEESLTWLSASLRKTAEAYSRQHGMIVYAETDYFGGVGDQGAAFWKDGKIVYESRRNGPINEALKLLGVEVGDEFDEFEAVGLHRFRDEEDINLAFLDQLES